MKYVNIKSSSLISKAVLLITAMIIFGSIKWFMHKEGPSNFFVVGTNSGYPPYEVIDENGNMVGFDIDVAQQIAQALGKKLEIKDMSFDALIVALQQGKIDCAIAGISITKSQQQEIALVHYFGDPLTKLPLVFWGEIPAGIKDAADLALSGNKTVCAQAGTIQHEIISSYPGLDVKSLSNIPDLIMDIKYGKSIAAVLEPKVAYALQAQYPELKILDIPLVIEQQDFGSGIGICKTNIKLINKISAIVSTLKSNGTIGRLEEKWFKAGGSHDQ